MPSQRTPGAISRRAFLAGTLTALVGPALTGCAGLNAYRERATLHRGRFAVIENYSASEVCPEEVDQLLERVATMLGVQLDPAKPTVRIVITTPDRIADLYRGAVGSLPGHSTATALYFPGANLVMVPYCDRALLGHELAHYVTDQYLSGAPRGEWEAIAARVERRLLAG